MNRGATFTEGISGRKVYCPSFSDRILFVIVVCWSWENSRRAYSQEIKNFLDRRILLTFILRQKRNANMW